MATTVHLNRHVYLFKWLASTIKSFVSDIITASLIR